MKFAGVYLAILAVTIASIAGDDIEHYNGYKVLRVTPANEQQFEALIELSDSGSFDFWDGPSKKGSSDIMAAPGQIQALTNFFNQHGLKYSVMIEDVEKIVSEERAQEAEFRAKNPSPRLGWTSYHTYDEIIAWTHEIAASHSSIASTQVIGRSGEGRDIVLLKIATGGAANKPAIFIDGTFHAREWITPATVTYIINELLTNGANYQDILNSVDIYIVPIVNPDGYVYTRTSRMWRKTRSDHSSPLGCRGVDPNRNFDDHFGGSGSSNDKCSDTYRGPVAFSEPETAALRDFIMSTQGTINWRVYLSVHSYSQLWLSPWNWTTGLPSDHNDLIELGNAGAEALRQVHGTRYTVGSGANVLYFSSGCSVDWFKSTGNFKYSYTLELRDTGAYGFLLPANQIIPNSEEVWAGVQVVLRDFKR